MGTHIARNLGRAETTSRASWRRQWRAVPLGAALALALSACGATRQGTAPQAHHATPTATHTATSAPTSAPTSASTPPTHALPTPIPAQGWATYMNTAYHFSLEYPANWPTPGLSTTANNFEVYDFDPQQLYEPSIPPPLVKFEVDAASNPTRQSPADFFAAMQNQPGQAGPVGTPTTSAASVAGRQALRVMLVYPAGSGLPPNLSYFVPDGQTMFILTQTDAANGQPAPEFTHLVSSFAISG